MYELIVSTMNLTQEKVRTNSKLLLLLRIIIFGYLHFILNNAQNVVEVKDYMK